MAATAGSRSHRLIDLHLQQPLDAPRFPPGVDPLRVARFVVRQRPQGPGNLAPGADLHLGVLHHVANRNHLRRGLDLVVERNVREAHVAQELRRVPLKGVGLGEGVPLPAVGSLFPERLLVVERPAEDPLNPADVLPGPLVAQLHVPALGQDAMHHLPRCMPIGNERPSRRFVDGDVQQIALRDLHQPRRLVKNRRITPRCVLGLSRLPSEQGHPQRQTCLPHPAVPLHHDIRCC